jgi:CBS domain-containing protein
MREPTAASVMTRPVVTVRPDTPFKDVVATMAGKGISAVPVVDEQGRPIGVVSEADALAKQEFHGATDPMAWLASRRKKTRWHKASGLTAADLMTAPVVTIGADDTVTLAARRLAEKRLRRLFVVDEAGKLAGVVSRRDVIAMFLRGDEEIRADVEQQVLVKGMWIVPGSVSVQVVDGVVTLAGKLDHRTTAEIAGRLAQAVAGVVSVHNNIAYEVDDVVSTGL